MKERVIIKNRNTFFNREGDYIVVMDIPKDIRAKLAEWCETPETSDLCFTISKYAKAKVAEGVDQDTINQTGTGLASVKLEACEYDWKYKGKEGHTKKWQVIGILHKEPLTSGELEGLEDD